MKMRWQEIRSADYFVLRRKSKLAAMHHLRIALRHQRHKSTSYRSDISQKLIERGV